MLSGETSMTGGPPPVTVRVTGTVTRGVTGSLLLTQSVPVKVPVDSPVESYVTVTGSDPPPGVDPEFGETLAQGISLGVQPPPPCTTVWVAPSNSPSGLSVARGVTAPVARLTVP
jgi:hypothetical protein